MPYKDLERRNAHKRERNAERGEEARELWRSWRKTARSRVVAAKREYVEAYRRAHPCERCGFTDTRALVFHHRDPATKEFEISALIGGHLSVPKLCAEIEKCAVLCANCHLILHAEQRREEAAA